MTPYSSIKIILFVILVMSMGCSRNSELPSRSVISFNTDWKFHLGDQPKAKQTDFDDGDWSAVDVPHDWIFEEGVTKNGIQGQQGGYHGGGIGWYRKSFDWDKDWKNNNVYISFDGVYMNSEVWINGNYLGKRPYGYISFRYEISKYLKKGQNIITVRVDNSKEPSARWYHPGGIYAPVHLIVTSRLHIKLNGIFVSTPKISATAGSVQVSLKIQNDDSKTQQARVETSVLSPSGKQIAKDLTKNIPYTGSSLDSTSLDLQVDNPRRWSPDSPTLYTLITKIFNKQKLVDEVHTKFGFRTIEWKKKTGFWLNGKNIKLKGVAEHYEGGPVGGAWTKPLLRWKLKLLKHMGINTIRTAHNPYPPLFYDLCDEMGLLVMDEFVDGWKKKAPYDYGARYFDDWWKRDMTEWISRDRNHPSVYIYSLGNETRSPVAPELVRFGHHLDNTRLFTSGSSNEKDMDVIGENGGSEHKSFLESKGFDKPFVATEAPHTWQTREYYRTQTWWRDGPQDDVFKLPDLTDDEIFFYYWTNPQKWSNRKQHLQSSYDNATVRISARKYWEEVRDTKWISGSYRWTGFDYPGEALLAHGGWPMNMFMGGALDVAGFKKDLYYFYQSQWTQNTMLHILPDWTHPRMPKGTRIPVWAYSNADEVELFLNGKSLGKDKPGKKWNEMQCQWMVPYKPGKLEAVAYNNGKEVGRTQMNTVKRPTKLKNTVQKLDAEDEFEPNYIITTEGIGPKGNLYPYAANTVYYNFPKNMDVLALENGSPTDSTNRVKTKHRKMFMGKTRAFLKQVSKSESAIVTIGAILGDKKLYSSSRIAIDAEQLVVSGDSDTSKLSITYTTDGTDPEEDGIVYKGPFKIKDETVVRAIVKSDGKIVLKMNETFGKKEGMFWGDKHSDDIYK